MFDEKDQLEKLLNLYLDGQLPEADKAKVREILASDEAAASLLMKICRLNKNLQSLATPLPVDWEKLANHLSPEIAKQTQPGLRLAVDSLPDELEQLIVASESQDWTANQQAELEQAITDHPGADRLVGQQKALGILLQHAMPLPEVNYNLLGQQISQAVAAQAIGKTDAHVDSIDEAQELEVVNYVSGDMPLAGQDEWEQEAKADPALAELTRQHQSLDAMLAGADPMPEVRWDVLQKQIGAATREQLSGEDKSIKLTAWLKQTTRIAAAACVVMALALTWRTLSNSPQDHKTLAEKTQPVKEIVAVDAPETSETGEAIAEVTIGPSENASIGGYDIYAAGLVVSNTPNIQVAIQTEDEAPKENPDKPEMDPGL